jgi:hypothetical protein
MASLTEITSLLIGFQQEYYWMFDFAKAGAGPDKGTARQFSGGGGLF